MRYEPWFPLSREEFLLGWIMKCAGKKRECLMRSISLLLFKDSKGGNVYRRNYDTMGFYE